MLTFWSVYFGSSLALITVFLVQEIYRDYKRKKFQSELDALFDELEDLEADDDFEDEFEEFIARKKR